MFNVMVFYKLLIKSNKYIRTCLFQAHKELSNADNYSPIIMQRRTDHGAEGAAAP